MTTEEVHLPDPADVPAAHLALEKPIGEEEESRLGDFVEDDSAESPFDTASLTLRRKDVARALDSLPDRRRKVESSCAMACSGRGPSRWRKSGRRSASRASAFARSRNSTLKRLESLPEAQGLRDASA